MWARYDMLNMLLAATKLKSTTCFTGCARPPISRWVAGDFYFLLLLPLDLNARADYNREDFCESLR